MKRVYGRLTANHVPKEAYALIADKTRDLGEIEKRDAPSGIEEASEIDGEEIVDYWTFHS